MNTIARIWNDTTKNINTGRYSMKRLQAWGAFFFAMFLSLADVVDMNVWPDQSFSVSKPNVEILWVWATIALGATAITAWGKIKGLRAGLEENAKEE